MHNRHQGVYLEGYANQNHIKDNSVQENMLAGIAIFGSSRNHVVGNDISANASGVFIQSSGGQPADENVVLRNQIRANGEGIFVYGPSDFPIPLPGPSGTVIRANEVHANGDDGIDVRGPSTLISKNSADNNGDLGIEEVSEVSEVSETVSVGKRSLI